MARKNQVFCHILDNTFTTSDGYPVPLSTPHGILGVELLKLVKRAMAPECDAFSTNDLELWQLNPPQTFDDAQTPTFFRKLKVMNPKDDDSASTSGDFYYAKKLKQFIPLPLDLATGASGEHLVHFIVRLPAPTVDVTDSCYSHGPPDIRELCQEGPGDDEDLHYMRVLRDFLWGNPEALESIRTTELVEVPSLGGLQEPSPQTVTTYDLSKIPGYKDNEVLQTRFYLRQEYKELDEYIKTSKDNDRKDNDRKHILVLSQRGIGKTVYLTYCLITRLVQKKRTSFLQSPQKQFVFLPDGVCQLPPLYSSTLFHKILDATETDDALSLMDLNDSYENVNRDLTVWPTLVAATLSSRPRYKHWLKQFVRHIAEFAMYPFSWDEFYIVSRMLLAPEGKNPTSINEWRSVFTKFSGSVRDLLGEVSYEDLMSGIHEAIDSAKLPGLFSSDFDDVSDRLLMAEPCTRIAVRPQDNDNDNVNVNVSLARMLTTTVDRATVPDIGFISQYVLRLFMQKRVCCVNDLWTLRTQSKTLIENDIFLPLARGLFKYARQIYLPKRFRQGPIVDLRALGKEKDDGAADSSEAAAPVTLSVDLTHITNEMEFHTHLPSAQTLVENPTNYFTSEIPVSLGIDSFVVKIDEENGMVTVILFQFAVSHNRPIMVDPSTMNKWMDENPSMKNLKWKWMLVFVVPKPWKKGRGFSSGTRDVQTVVVEQQIPPGFGATPTNQMKLKQFNWEIDLDKAWDAVEERVMRSG